MRELLRSLPGQVRLEAVLVFVFVICRGAVIARDYGFVRSVYVLLPKIFSHALNDWIERGMVM